jgi:DNA-binding NtrC family response regulator
LVNKKRSKVLVVDDRLDWLLKCADMLSEEGYEVRTCSDPLNAMAVFREYGPDAVLLDVKMPGRDGLEILTDMKIADPWVVVIMLSNYGDTETVVKAMKLKADYFIDKNYDMGKVPLVVEKEIRSKGIEIDNLRLRADQGGGVVLAEDIIGECPAMRKVKELVRTFADSDKEVLLTGPTGAGKDHVAMALHYESKRRNEPFRNLRCPNVPLTLFEAEVFGHEKGAYTDAHRRGEGLIPSAGGGTVLLNEFVDIPLQIQAKFLGVLDYGIYNTVGGNGKQRVTHARFMAATNCDINQAIDENRLREDLLYRLKKIWIRIPPLNERGDDIIRLAEHFIEKECREINRPVFSLSPRSKDSLMTTKWRGNVRQLAGFIGVMVQSGQEEITESPEPLQGGPSAGNDTELTLDAKLKRIGDQVERREIENALRLFNGSRKRAAEYLGISYRKLLYKMKTYGLRELF